MSEDVPPYPYYGPYIVTPEWRREVLARLAAFDVALAMELRKHRQTCVTSSCGSKRGEADVEGDGRKIDTDKFVADCLDWIGQSGTWISFLAYMEDRGLSEADVEETFRKLMEAADRVY